MRRLATFVLAVTVGLTGLTTATASSGSAAGRSPGEDPAARALNRLRADADGSLRLHRDTDGVVDFVGTPADATVDNPARPDTSATRSSGDAAVSAARQDLTRYGAALGITDPAGDLSAAGQTRSGSGGTVVRFDQHVDGLPVIGGQVVVSLDRTGRLSSLQASTSDATSADPARVGRSAAAATARRVTARDHHLGAGTLRADGGDLWVFDPAALGAAAPVGASTVRRFEVTHGADVRETVLVDARSGRVLLHFNDVQSVGLDRRVCDRNNKRHSDSPCTTPVRTEGGAPVAVADANSAYDLSGDVADFYRQIGGLDLTELIGRGASGSRTLASTVRYCEVSKQTRCPKYDNAFWNGSEMYYGDGYAGADDVVGHEMTHGVISRYSDLFYFFQSGAINESLADVMGEILDHRRAADAGSPEKAWTMGEDLPTGALRDLRDPPRFGQPGRMGSSLYDTDPEVQDSGGVHTNSGVGNKTAYLISQGGTFNGVRVTGIDAGDPRLTKTATLYLDVIKSLSSGSDYADLGRVLSQSCADLAGAGTVGIDTADCAQVARAERATELSKQPSGAAVPAAAPAVGCPTGSRLRVLFDDETAAPSEEMARGSLWTRAPNHSFRGWDIATNATSGTGSWFGKDPDPSAGEPSRSTMSLAKAVTVRRGVKTYLRFNHWYAFDYGVSPRAYYDGGLVLVDDVNDSAGARQTAGLPWVNGPKRTVIGSGPRATGFGGLSNGWTSSRVDLSSYAGKTIRPEFQLRGDSDFWLQGWYLDDVEVYSCDPVLPSAARAVSVTGSVGGARVAWTAPSYAGTGISGYRVAASGQPLRTVPAHDRSARYTGLAPRTPYSFTVRPLNAAGDPGPATTVRAAGTRSWVDVARTGSRATRVTGRLLTAERTALPRRRVAVQRQAADGTWSTLTRVTTSATGRVGVTLAGRSRSGYRLVFGGAVGLVGCTSPPHRL